MAVHGLRLFCKWQRMIDISLFKKFVLSIPTLMPTSQLTASFEQIPNFRTAKEAC